MINMTNGSNINMRFRTVESGQRTRSNSSNRREKWAKRFGKRHRVRCSGTEHTSKRTSEKHVSRERQQIHTKHTQQKKQQQKKKTMLHIRQPKVSALNSKFSQSGLATRHVCTELSFSEAADIVGVDYICLLIISVL